MNNIYPASFQILTKEQIQIFNNEQEMLSHFTQIAVTLNIHAHFNIHYKPIFTNLYLCVLSDSSLQPHAKAYLEHNTNQENIVEKIDTMFSNNNTIILESSIINNNFNNNTLDSFDSFAKKYNEYIIRKQQK